MFIYLFTAKYVEIDVIIIPRKITDKYNIPKSSKSTYAATFLKSFCKKNIMPLNIDKATKAPTSPFIVPLSTNGPEIKPRVAPTNCIDFMVNLFE